jgi:hypothetical protein
VPIPRPAPGTARWWVVGTIGITLGCAMAIWLGLANTVGRPSWSDLSYHVVDDSAVDVTYVVGLPAGRSVTCAIQALDKSFGTVGVVEVRIPAAAASSVQRTTRVRTTSRAVTGVVSSCSVG